LIKFENVSYVYSMGTPFEKVALSNINLNIKEGILLGIIGHTGSGKSTLVQMMNALLMPTHGVVYINGKDIKDKSTNLKHLRATVGLVFQYPEHQLFEETVRKEIAFGPKNLNLPTQEIENRVDWAMEVVGLPRNLSDKSPFDLSGGQKRRVAIASVLSMRPKVLILDEPTAGLDPRAKKTLLNEIVQMHKQMGITVILVSHSMEEIASIADRIIVLHNGKIKYDDTPDRVFSNISVLEKMGLDVPEVTRLMHKLNLPLCYTVQDAKAILLSCLIKKGE
jgi:energy-coupling factor transport system ATP-binding protein